MPRLLSGYALLVATALGWSGAWVIARAAAHEAPALAVTVGRFALAALVLLPAWWLLPGGRRLPRRADLPLLLGMACTGVAAYTILFLTGMRFAPASDGAVITPAVAAASGMAIAWVGLGQRPRGREVLGAALALAGVVLVGAQALGAAGLGSERALGDLLLVGAGLAWGAYTVLSRRASDRIPAVTGILAASALGAVLVAPLALAIHGPGGFQGWSGLAWANVLYLGVVATAVSFVTFYLGIQRVGVARAAPFYGLIPVFAVAEAAALLGESLTPLHLAGGTLVAAGIALPALLARREAARAVQPQAAAAAEP